MKVLGVDPGLASCGWALIETNDKKYKLVSYGEIKTYKSSDETPDFSSRLKKIFVEFKKILSKYHPDVVCIEKQFYSKISKNMIDTYIALGVIYLLCGLLNIDVKEFSAKTIKLAISGYGSATKLQIKKMTKILLNEEKDIKSEHINDAIATALCYLNTNNKDILYV